MWGEVGRSESLRGKAKLPIKVTQQAEIYGRPAGQHCAEVAGESFHPQGDANTRPRGLRGHLRPVAAEEALVAVAEIPWCPLAAELLTHPARGCAHQPRPLRPTKSPQLALTLKGAPGRSH